MKNKILVINEDVGEAVVQLAALVSLIAHLRRESDTESITDALYIVEKDLDRISRVISEAVENADQVQSDER